MKTILIILVAGVLGWAAWSWYQRANDHSPSAVVGRIADRARDSAAEAKAAVVDNAEDWKLTPSAIQEELAKTGQVVRANAYVLGEHIDDARITAVIKGRFIVEKSLSAFAISVDCRDGNVQLTGSVTSEDAIARAVALALQTSGVRNVVSRLAVKN